MVAEVIERSQRPCSAALLRCGGDHAQALVVAGRCPSTAGVGWARCRWLLRQEVHHQILTCLLPREASQNLAQQKAQETPPCEHGHGVGCICAASCGILMDRVLRLLSGHSSLSSVTGSHCTLSAVKHRT